MRPLVLSWTHHLLERAAHAGLPRRDLLALLPGAIIGDLAGARLAFDHGEPVAGLGRAVEAQHLDRHRRAGRDHSVAGIGHQRADAAPFGAGNDDVAGLERAALHQHGRDRAAAAVEPRLDHGAFGRPVRIGLEIEHFGLQRDHVEQLVEIALLLGRNLDLEHVAAEQFDLDLVLQQFGAHALGLGVGLVDLVDGDDDRHLRRLGVLDRLDRLRHDAVVGGDHQDHDVGDLGAARAHRREGGVAGRVDEGDAAARRRRHLIGADMLRDAAGLAGCDLGRADGVEQRRLAVIDVAHDGDDRRARLQVCRIVGGVEHALFDVGFGDAPHRVAEFLGDELGGVGVDRVGDLRHVALLHEDADHVDRALGHAVGELLDRDRLGDRHFAGDLFLRLVVAVPGHALHAAAERGDRALAHFVGGKSGDDGEAAAAFFGAAAGRFGCRRRPRRCAGATADVARCFFVVGLEHWSRGAGLRSRGDGVGAKALLGDFVGLALGFLVVLAALFFVGLAGFRRDALGAIGFFAAMAHPRLFLGDLAFFRFAQSRVGKRMSPRAALLLGKRAQHNAGWFSRRRSSADAGHRSGRGR